MNRRAGLIVERNDERFVHVNETVTHQADAFFRKSLAGTLLLDTLASSEKQLKRPLVLIFLILCYYRGSITGSRNLVA